MQKLNIRLAAAVALIAGCSDGVMPTNPGTDTPTSSAPFLVTAVAGAAASGDVVYFSLPAKSLPTGTAGAIRVVRTGTSASVTLIDGGFDPVALNARAGDSVVVTIVQDTGTAPVLAYHFVISAVPTPPVVIRTDPPAHKRDVPLNSSLRVVFSEPIDPASLTSTAIQLQTGSVVVDGQLSFTDASHTTAQFLAAGPLTSNTDYELVIKQGIKDLTGDALAAPVTVPFTTGQAALNPPVAAITVAPSGLTLPVGTTAPLVTTPRDAFGNALSGRTLIWSSTTPNIATVSGAGLVTAVAIGNGFVNVTSDGITTSVPVSVIPTPVASVSVDPGAVDLPVGNSLPLAVTLRDGAGNTLTGRAVTWQSSAPGVVTVSDNGVVTAIAEGGPVTITARSEGRSGTAVVNAVGPRGSVASVWIDPPLSPLNPGTQVQLRIFLEDSAYNLLSEPAVTWSSSSPAIIGVSQAGVVTGLALGGPVTITATSQGKSGTLQLSVVPPPPPAAPNLVTVTVTTVTTGADQDPTGYYVATNFGPTQAIPIGANETKSFTSQETGSFAHDVWLTDIDPNCLTSVSPQTFTSVPTGTIHLTFTVSCSPRSTLPATDSLVGVWQTVKYELFRDPAFTSRMDEMVSRGQVGTLVFGPSSGGLLRWQWQDVYDAAGDLASMYAGTSTIGATGLTSTTDLIVNTNYCCGLENNPPIDGSQTVTRTNDTMTITSLAPTIFGDDWGTYVVYIRMTLRKVR